MDLELKQKLELGLKLPLRAPFLFRIFGKKQVVFTVFPSKMGTGIAVGRIYLSIPRNPQSKIDETIAELNKSAGKIARMAALTIIDDRFYGFRWALLTPFSYWLKNNAPLDKLWLISTLVFLDGVESYVDAFRLLETEMNKPFNQTTI